LIFIVNLSASVLRARPVNSGVRHASRKQGGRVAGGGAQKTDAELNDLSHGRSNNSFNRSGNSSDVIRKIEGCSVMLPAALIRALCRFAKTKTEALTQVEDQQQNAGGSFQQRAVYQLIERERK
jgi:hypothetical protein